VGRSAASAWAWATVIPMLALASRRLNDAGLSGAWLLLLLWPPGAIVVMVMLALGSRESGVRLEPIAAPLPRRMFDA
jgi:uncharacterized membrane protein YhaH (DUF805 family)